MVKPWKPCDSYLERSQGSIQDPFPNLMRCSSSAPAGQHVCLCVHAVYVCLDSSLCVCVCYNYPCGLQWYRANPSHPSHSRRTEQTQVGLLKMRNQPPGPEITGIHCLEQRAWSWLKRPDFTLFLSNRGVFKVLIENLHDEEVPASWVSAGVAPHQEKKNTIQSLLLI